MSLRPFVALAFGCALVLGTAATSAQAAPSPQTEPTVAQACDTSGPLTKIKGTNVNMRATPGGAWVGTAQNGDCLYLYGYTNGGPSVNCTAQVSTPTWYDVYNYRLLKRGWVSACCISD